MTAPLLLTLERAAETLAISARSVRRLIDAGELAPIRIGRSVRLSAADLTAYVDRQVSGSTIALGVVVPGDSTCHDVRPRPDRKKGSTNGHARRIGGPSTPAGSGVRLAAVLGFPSPTIPKV